MKKSYTICNKLLSILGANTIIPKKTKDNDFYTGTVTIENGEKIIRCSNGNSFSITDFQDTSKYHKNNPVIIGKLYWSKDKPVLIKAIDILNIEDSETNHKKSPLSAPLPWFLTSEITILYLLGMHMLSICFSCFFEPFLVVIGFLLTNAPILLLYNHKFNKKYNNWKELYHKNMLHIVKIILILLILQPLPLLLSYSTPSLIVSLLAICAILIYYYAHNIKVVQPSLKIINIKEKTFKNKLHKKAKLLNKDYTQNQTTNTTSNNSTISNTTYQNRYQTQSTKKPKNSKNRTGQDINADVLTALKEAFNRGDKFKTQREIAKKAGVDDSQVSRALDELEKQYYIDKRKNLTSLDPRPQKPQN